MTESILHRAAKNQLAHWLTETSDEDTEIIHTEYPVAINEDNDLTGLNGWPDGVPSYDDLIEIGMMPLVIFDVAVLVKGILHTAYEVVHTHGVTAQKRAYLKRLRAHGPLDVFTVPAKWIVAQPSRPSRLRPILTCRRHYAEMGRTRADADCYFDWTTAEKVEHEIQSYALLMSDSEEYVQEGRMSLNEYFERIYANTGLYVDRPAFTERATMRVEQALIDVERGWITPEQYALACLN